MVTAPAGEGGNDQGQQGAEVGAGAANGSNTGTDEGKTFTQADLDRVVEQRLARERARFGDYDDLKSKAAELDKIRDGEKSELQKAVERLTELESQNKKYAHSELQRGVAAKIDGFPAHLADRLRGDTEEELRADAEELLKNLPTSGDGNSKKAKSPTFRSGATSTESTVTAKEKAAAALRSLRE